jgi:ubiquinone/menaquinone biosynthesis C-methylase UbiE
MDFSIFVEPKTKNELNLNYEGNELVNFNTDKNTVYPLQHGIPNFIFPTKLHDQDAISKNFYEGRAEQYEDSIHLTFHTHNLDEIKTRKSFIDKLHLSDKSKVLEVACGTGRDSEIILQMLDSNAQLHMQDISYDMMRICYNKLSSNPKAVSFSLSNALYLPYPDNTFDAVYSFGAIGEFSNISKALSEMVRVVKVGGRIVVGDESVPVWLRKTEYFKILKATNPMFESPLPLESLPVEARDTSIQFVIGESFYLIDFTVGSVEPKANFDYIIPGVRGGTYRTRYEGGLEGVSKETKKLAWEKVKQLNTNMYDWLDAIVRKESKK